MDSLYSDTPEAGAEGSAAQNPPKPSGDDMQTALIPKSLLAGKDFKPGDEVVLKIVRFTNDEAEVQYAYGDEGDEEEEQAPEPAEEPAPGGEAGEESMYS